MELKFALLADLVSETIEGKLNILGTFDGVNSFTEPIVHPRCYLVARFEARTSEGNQHFAQVGIVDADGQPVLEVGPEIPMQFGTAGPGHPFRGQLIVEVTNLTLPKFGDYEFRIKVGGKLEATVPITAKFSSSAPRE